MTWFRLPLMVWAIYATSLVMVLATPVLAMSLLLIIAERWFGVPIFNPDNGGDPLLFQHLFWFYSHPAVYIMILPAMGVVSEIFTCFARRRVFGYAAMIYSMLDDRGDRLHGLGPSHVRIGAIALRQPGVLIPVVHRRGAVGHQGVQLDRHALPRPDHVRSADALRDELPRPVHDRRVDRACSLPRCRSTSTSPTLISSSRISISSWWAAAFRRSSPACISGGRRSPGACTTKTGRKFSAVTTFVGFMVTFMPQFIMGYAGMPRRYHVYPDVVSDLSRDLDRRAR